MEPRVLYSMMKASHSAATLISRSILSVAGAEPQSHNRKARRVGSHLSLSLSRIGRFSWQMPELLAVSHGRILPTLSRMRPSMLKRTGALPSHESGIGHSAIRLKDTNNYPL